MGISYILTKRKSCPASLLAENSIEDISNIFFFPLKGSRQQHPCKCTLLTVKPMTPLVSKSHWCCSKQDRKHCSEHSPEKHCSHI